MQQKDKAGDNQEGTEAVETDTTSEPIIKTEVVTVPEYITRSVSEENLQETIYAVKNAVGNYLSSFIEDINTGRYSAMYSYVEYGSKMEQLQKDFIAKSFRKEELLKYSVVNTTRIDSSTYHATAIEDYDVYEGGDSYDTHYYVQQKCTYKVNKQPDGKWLISNFVENIEELNKIVYY